MRKVLGSLRLYQRRRHGGGGLAAAESFPHYPNRERKKVFNILETLRKVFHHVENRVEKIVSRETLDRIPQFCLQFGERFTAERVEHPIIERAEEQTTMLESVCI